MFRCFWKNAAAGAMVLMIIVMQGCSSRSTEESRGNDSLFLNQAYAKTDSSLKESANEDAYESRHTAITRAAALAGPAVVGINVMQVKRYVRRSPFYTEDPVWRSIFPELFRDQVYEKPIQNLGSGFIISSDGYIVTNDHVVTDGKEIVVTLSGGERHNAKLVGTDRISDISLLKIDGQDLPYLQMGNSKDLIVGEWVIAIGNPFGLFELNNQPTVTVGVISAINRDWGRIPESGRLYMDMIQTDAAINHGNSGGPLLNALGQVIGMNTFIYTGNTAQEGFVGIGFAIPIDRIRDIVDQIKQNGSVNRNFWLGLKVQNLSPVIGKAMGLDIKNGVIVTQVEKGSSADLAGLEPEDVITRINGKGVNDTRGLVGLLNNVDLQVGDELNLVIIRNRKEQNVKVKLIQQPD